MHCTCINPRCRAHTTRAQSHCHHGPCGPSCPCCCRPGSAHVPAQASGIPSSSGRGEGGGGERQLCLAVMIPKADLTAPPCRSPRIQSGQAQGVQPLQNSRDKVYVLMSQCRAAATAAAHRCCWSCCCRPPGMRVGLATGAMGLYCRDARQGGGFGGRRQFRLLLAVSVWQPLAAGVAHARTAPCMHVPPLGA